MSKRDCRSCQTCSEYEPADVQPEAVVLDLTALLGEVQDDVSREAELEARLADAERRAAARPSEVDVMALKSEVARLRQTVAKRDRELNEAAARLEHYARDLQNEGVAPEGAVLVLFAYDAWQCLDGSVNCSRRYYADDPEHGCGPLTPVTVTVARRPAS
jgi:uncharacterized coiled-coil protein SlyX